jgi:hypothetical protein
MAKTLIEENTNKRFATKFTTLEDYSPTSERVLVFKDFKDSPNFIVLKYIRTPEGKIQQVGELEEIPETEFKEQHAPHTSWDGTSLKEFDNKWSDWRASSLVDKLEMEEQPKGKRL